jgi:hypothetical protein
MLHVSIGVLQNRLIYQRSRMSRHLVRRRRQERRTRLRAAMPAVTLITLLPQQPLPMEPRRIPVTNRLHRPLRNQGQHPRIHTRAISSQLEGNRILVDHIPPTRRSHNRILMGVRLQLHRANTPPQGILDTSTNNIWSTAKPL